MTDEVHNESFAEVEARITAEEKAAQDGERAPATDPPATPAPAATPAAPAAEPKVEPTAEEVAAKAAAEAKAAEEAVAAAKAKEDAAKPTPEPTLPLNRHKAILQSERQARESAEQRAQELERRLAEVSAKPSAKRTADLAKLKEDFPEEMVGVLEGLQGEIDSLRAQLTQQQESRDRAAADSIQDAIDANHDLQAWQEAATKEGATAEDQMRWQRAIAWDQTLIGSPLWKKKPISERFAAAVAEVRKEFGEAPAVQAAPPAPAAPSLAAPAAPQAKPLPATKPAAPTTLSDVPGGLPPATGKLDAFNAMDPIAALASFGRMTDAQFEQALSQLT